MNIRFRPLRPGEFPERGKERRSSVFRVTWRTALSELERELEFLGASEVVISAGMTETDIRIDGWPRADVRPWHPGVIISFDSTHGPLRYFCDEYEDEYRGFGHYLTGYQANIRAITLGLEALRAVDRYGITRRGEQYTGWRQLGAGAGPTTREEAEALIARYGGMREALFRTHPDHGGSTAEFAAVQAARALLGAAS